MDKSPYLHNSYEKKIKHYLLSWKWPLLHLDGLLLLGLLVLCTLGLFTLYSASNENMGMVDKQIIHLSLGFIALFIVAQIPPHRYYQWAPWIFTLSITLLIAVLVIGEVNNGARRWLNLGLGHFQPSELIKIALPLMLARYFNDKVLPAQIKDIMIASLLLLIPILLTVKQPDLGTAVLIGLSGGSLLLLAGISFRLIGGLIALALISAPVAWHYLHFYQKERILTFIDPERDALGSGYHIIQSKIAIGSGGIWGKGWLAGTQSHLHFLPAHTTDFIFAVMSEEFGLIGAFILILVFCCVVLRGIWISLHANNTFARLLAGSLIWTFMFSVLINIGMVIGILPVVGIPLQLISYGGSSIVTLMIGFGIIMSIQTHQNLLKS